MGDFRNLPPVEQGFDIPEPGPRLLRPYEDVQQDLTQAHPTYVKWHREQAEADQRQFMLHMQRATEQDPELAAKASKLGIELGLDREVIARNIEKAQQLYALEKVREAKLAESSPILYRQMMNPEFAAMAIDEFDKLAWYERFAKNFEAGQIEVELGELNTFIMEYPEAATPKMLERIEDLNTQLRDLPTGDSFIGGTGRVIGQMANAETAATAGLALAAGVVIPPVGIALGLGAAAVAARQAYEVEAGLAYNEYVRGGMDPRIARDYARTVGMWNALIEVGSFGLAAKPFMAAGRNVMRRSGLVRRVVGNGLTKDTVQRNIFRTALRGTFQVSQEVGQEIAQETVTAFGELWGMKATEALDAINIASGRTIEMPGGGSVQTLPDGSIVVDPEIVYRLTGQRVKEPQTLSGASADRFVDDLRQIYPLESTLTEEKLVEDLLRLSMSTAGQAFKSMLAISQIGPVAQHFSEAKRLRRSARMAEAMQRVGEQVKSTKFQQRDSTKLALYLRRVWKGKAFEKVYIDREEFKNALDAANVTVDEIDEAFPGVRDQLAADPAEQPDIELDGGAYFAELAQTDLFERLVEHARPSPELSSLKVQKEEQEALKAKEKELGDLIDGLTEAKTLFDEEAVEIANQFAEGAIEAGAEPAAARDNGKLFSLAIARMAGAREITPKVLLEELGVDPRVVAGQDITSPQRFRIFVGENAKIEGEIGKGLGEAAQMAAEGARAEEIRAATGWFIGPDGLPRYEISDRNAKLKTPKKEFLKRTDARRLKGKDVAQLPLLSEVLDHPVLFEAYGYPLNQMRVATMDLKRQGLLGGYNPDLNVLIVDKGARIHDMISIVLHETQHAIQDVEGMASGGTSLLFRDDKIRTELKIRDLTTLRDQINSRVRFGLRASIFQLLDNTIELMKLRLAGRELDAFVLEKALHDAGAKVWKQINEAVTEGDTSGRDFMERVQNAVQTSSHRYYTRLGGEIEARNVQTRHMFTDQKRAETPPWHTEDVPRTQLIRARTDPISLDTMVEPDLAGAEPSSTDFARIGPRLRQVLTTTVPTTKKEAATHDPTDVQLSAKEAAFKPGAEKATAHNIGLFKQRKQTATKDKKPVTRRTYDGVKVKGRTPEQKAESIIGHMVTNLLKLFDAVPEKIRQRSKLWYVGANKMAGQLAIRYQKSKRQIAGMFAVMSPQADWRMNVSYVERVLDMLENRMDFRSDKAMDAWMKEWSAKNKGKKSSNVRYYKLAKGKTLRQLSKLADKEEALWAQAIWMRGYDAVHNNEAFRDVTPEGRLLDYVKNNDGSNAKIQWKSLLAIRNAIAIYNNEDAIHESLGEKHKVRNFFNNIWKPNSKLPFVTADTHQVAANLLLPLGGDAYEVQQNLGGTGSAKAGAVGLQGTYWLYHEAVIRAAEKRGVLPREMQSISWEAVRGLFSPEFKRNQKHVEAVRDIWKDYENGKLTQTQAINRVFKYAGGVNPPSWTSHSPRAGRTFGGGGASYEGRVSDVRVSGRGGRGADAGRGGAGRARRAVPTRKERLRQLSGEAVVGGEFDPNTFEIFLHRKQTPASMTHELGHMLFELKTLAYVQGKATEDEIADLETLAVELGDFDSIDDYATAPLEARRKTHERVAYLFEKYMAEGKSPSIAAEGLFRRMAKWIARSYNAIISRIDLGYYAETGEHLPALTDEVRAVYDRWFASDAEIEARIKEDAIGELLAGEELDDLTRMMLADLVFDHENEAKEKLRAVYMSELRRLRGMRSARYRELQKRGRRARREAEIEQRSLLLRESHVARLLHFMSTGQILDSQGEVLDESANADANKGRRLFVTDDERVPARYRTKNPDTALIVDVDRFADEMGFASADDMFRALAETMDETEVDAGETLDRMVDDRTDAFMLAEMPHLSDPEIMQVEVDRAINNQALVKLRAAELAILDKRPPAQREMVRVARAVARKKALAMNTGDLFGHNNAIRQATVKAQRAERAALRARDRADVDELGRQQRSALYHRALAAELGELRQEFEKQVEKLRKRTRYKGGTGNAKNEDRLAKTYGGAALETVREMLRLYGVEDYPGRTPKADPWGPLDETDPERQELMLAYEDAQAIESTYGRIFNQPLDVAMDALLGAEGVLLRARRMRLFEMGDRKLELAEVLEQLQAQAEREMAPKRRRRQVTRGEKALARVRSWNATTQQVEALLRAIDGDRQGLLSELIYVPLREAEDRVEEATAAALGRLVKILEPLRDSALTDPIVSDLDDTGKPFLVDEQGRAFKFEDGLLGIIGALLHAGNRSNLQRLVTGYEWGQLTEDGFDASRWWAQVDRWVEAGVLKPEHFQAVQGIWDIYEELLLPMTQKAHYELLGREMELVERGLPELERYGIRGGYVPAARDPNNRSPKGDRYAQDTLLQFQRSIASVNRGMTKERVDEEKPDPLDLDVLNQPVHFRQSIIFAQMAPAHRKVAALLKNQDIAETLERLQPGIYKDYLDHFMETAATLSTTLVGAKSHDILSGMDWVNTLRRNYGTAAMFGNLINSLQGATGVVLALQQVPAKYQARAFTGASVTKAEMYELSRFMRVRHKLGVGAHELQQQILRLVDSGALKSVRQVQQWLSKNTYILQEMVQKPVDRIVWIGAYEQAMEQHGDQQKAVREADSAVRTTQSDTAALSLASSQKGGTFVKLFTQFSTWFLMLGSTRAAPVRNAILRDRTLAAEGASKAYRTMRAVTSVTFSTQTIAGFVTLYLGELIAEALRGEDDDEPVINFSGALYQTVLAAPRQFGPVGAVASTVIASLTGGEGYQQRMPAPSAVAILQRLAKTLPKFVDEDGVQAPEAVDLLEQLSALMGVPLGVLTQRLRRGLNVLGEQDEGSVQSLLTGRR